MRLVLAALLPFGAVPAQVARWLQLQPGVSPPPRQGHVLVHDAARERIVLHGGQNAGQERLDTWEFDGARWIQRFTSTGQPPGMPVAGAYDAQRARTVLVTDDGSGSHATWEWNGQTWQLRTSQGPSPRSGHAVAYDSVRHRTVLFGGSASGLGDASDTWEYDGTSWQQRGSGGPRGRFGHAMAFHATRGVVVLHGGRSESASTVFADTWEWNGTYWREHFGITGPSARLQHAMAFDPVADRIVLYGGWHNGVGGGVRFDTWEWDGQAWLSRATSLRPPGAIDAPMAFEPGTGRIVRFGGHPGTGSNSLGDTWAHALIPASVASFTPFGTGCPGPSGTPQLAAAGGSLPRLGGTFTLRLSNLPSSPINLPFGAFGSSNTTWNGRPVPAPLDAFGFFGCTAWIGPDVAVTLVNQGGTADWNIAVPFLPALAGIDFYVQGAVLVPGWNPGGLIVTNAGHGVAGAQ